MAINFPANPNPGDTYLFNGKTYRYQSAGYWAIASSANTLVADGVQVNLGSDNTKYITPKALSDSDYAKKTELTDAVNAATTAVQGVKQPNLFDNGSFDIWQRGTSFSGSGWHNIADRWKVTNTSHTGGTSTHSLQSNPIDGNYYQFEAAGHTDYSFVVQSFDLKTMPLSFFSGKTFTITYEMDSPDQIEAAVYFNLRTLDASGNNVYTAIGSYTHETITSGRLTKSSTFTFPDLSGYSSQVQTAL